MSKDTMETATALAFIATVFATAGIWVSGAPLTVKLVGTSMLFVLWAIAVVLAGRGSD